MEKKPQKKSASNRRKSRRAGSIDGLTRDDAYQVLRILHASGPEMAERIEHTIEDYLKTVDIEAIAEEIWWDLDFLQAEEVWDRSGSTRYGYVDPDDAAAEMFEEVISEHLTRIKDLQKRGMHREAGRYCLGILKGIDRFETESTTAFKDWLGDSGGFFLGMVFDTWRKGCTDQKERARTERRIGQEWPRLLRYRSLEY